MKIEGRTFLKKRQKIELLFRDNGGIMTTKELTNHGVSHYFIKRMLDESIIETVKRGIYKLSNYHLDEDLEVLTMIPKGVLCMFTSASKHELTTQIPYQYHVAIPKKSKVRLPSYPPVKLYYWYTSQYSLGITEIKQDNRKFLLYDPEKTVCDFLKFKNKIGLDVSKEILKTYLNGKSRNIDKLVKYSRELRIYSVVDQFLKVLL